MKNLLYINRIMRMSLFLKLYLYKYKKLNMKKKIL